MSSDLRHISKFPAIGSRCFETSSMVFFTGSDAARRDCLLTSRPDVRGARSRAAVRRHPVGMRHRGRSTTSYGRSDRHRFRATMLAHNWLSEQMPVAASCNFRRRFQCVTIMTRPRINMSIKRPAFDFEGACDEHAHFRMRFHACASASPLAYWKYTRLPVNIF